MDKTYSQAFEKSIAAFYMPVLDQHKVKYDVGPCPADPECSLIITFHYENCMELLKFGIYLTDAFADSMAGMVEPGARKKAV